MSEAAGTGEDGRAKDSPARTLVRAGRLAPGPGVRVARAGRVERGTVVEISLRMDDGVVAEAAYLAFGDMDVLTCAEVTCHRLVGQPVGAAKGMSGLDLAAAADLPQEALGAALAVEDALKAVLRQYENGIRESSRGSDGYKYRSD